MSANQSQLLDILECPVCLETCTPPIYQCQNGHVICNSCYGQVTTCGICRVLVAAVGIRCLVLEKMAEDLEVPCKFAAQGCQIQLKISDIAAHGLDCQFGSSIICRHLNGTKCTTPVKNNPDSIVTHLTESHAAVIVPTTDVGSISLTKSVLYSPPGRVDVVEQYPPMCLTYDGRVFLLLVTRAKETESFQVFLAGSSHAARAYNAKLTLLGPATTSALNMTWAGPVIGTDAKQPELKPHLKIYRVTMDSFVEMDAVTKKHSLKVSVAIMKSSILTAEETELRNKTAVEVTAAAPTGAGIGVAIPGPASRSQAQTRLLQQLLDTVRQPYNPERQQRVASALRAHPELLAEFMRHRQQNQ